MTNSEILKLRKLVKADLIEAMDALDGKSRPNDEHKDRVAETILENRFNMVINEKLEVV